MKVANLIVVMSLATASLAFAGNHDPKAIAAALPAAKITLLKGIARAEQTNGPATSAKFEIDDNGKLVLSIYNIPEGLAVSPEAATLMEIVYAATESEVSSSVEVFADKEHIARAASHMTLFQISRLSLTQVVQKAVSVRGGTAIDVRNPTVRDGRPVADVVIIDSANEAFTVTVGLNDRRASVRK